MKNILIIIFGFLSINGALIESKEKNYINYHREFAHIEGLIINEHFVEAELKLDTLFENYDVKFAKDYLIAGQVSLINEHREKGLDLINCAMQMGVKFDCLKTIKLFNDKITEEEWNNLKNEEDKLRKNYFKKIDLELYQEFHNRYQEEQKSKQSEYYKNVVYSNFSRIKNLIDSAGLIGEYSIGLDNQNLAKSISDCECGNSKIIATLLHYDYPISEIGEDKLIAEIENGNLHPRQFATIYNFEISKVSVLYRDSEKKYNNLSEYYFNFPFGKKSTDLRRVNLDRYKFGICKYEIDKKKNEISSKYGMKLKFNYK